MKIGIAVALWVELFLNRLKYGWNLLLCSFYIKQSPAKAPSVLWFHHYHCVMFQLVFPLACSPHCYQGDYSDEIRCHKSREQGEFEFWSCVSWTICFQNKIQTVAALEIKIHGPKWRVQRSCKAHWHLICCQKSPKCQQCCYWTESKSFHLHTSCRPECSHCCSTASVSLRGNMFSQPLLLSKLLLFECQRWSSWRSQWSGEESVFDFGFNE